MNNLGTLTGEATQLLQDVEAAMLRVSRRNDRHGTEISGLNGAVGSIGQRVGHEAKMAIPSVLIPPEMFARANANRNDIAALNAQHVDLSKELGTIQGSIKNASFLLTVLEERVTDIELRIENRHESLSEQDVKIFRQRKEVSAVIERYHVLERAVRALMVLEG